jgi:hypothetical protein
MPCNDFVPGIKEWRENDKKNVMHCFDGFIGRNERFCGFERCGGSEAAQYGADLYG